MKYIRTDKIRSIIEIRLKRNKKEELLKKIKSLKFKIYSILLSSF
jgi:c-di-GMP-related signal transduction protein